MDTEQINKPKNAKWKKVLFWLAIVVLSLPVLLFALGKIVEARVKKEIIAAVNEQVTVPVEVNGGIDLSLIQHFPYASVTFNDVVVKNQIKGGKPRLIQVGELSFLCHIYTLFGDKIEVKKMLIRDGEINLFVNDRGINNYSIFKASTNESKSNLMLQIKDATIKRVRFTYDDKRQNTSAALHVSAINLKGDFNAENFDLGASGKMKVVRLAMNGENFLAGKTVEVRLDLSVDTKRKKYVFKKGSLGIDNSEFIASGYLAEQKNGTQIDFTLSNSGSDMQKLFALFPERFRSLFAEAEGTGAYAIEASIKGLSGKNSSPKIMVKADLKNSQLKLNRYNKFLKNVNASAVYDFDELGNDKLVISNFDCILDNLPFRFALTLRHLANPEFNFSADGVLHLAEISSFIPDSVLQHIGGSIHFQNFKLVGKKDDFSNIENSSLSGSGTFELAEVEFVQNGVTYGNINGRLTYENQTVEAQHFTLNFLSTDFDFSGTIRNLLPFTYNLSAKRKSNDIVLGVNGKVKINTFNLTSLLETYDKKNRPEALSREKLKIGEVMNMNGNIDVSVERFFYRKMTFTGLVANLQVSPGNIRINQLSADGMQGKLRTSGNILFTTDNNLKLALDIQAIGLDIPKVFEQCENFGQNTLTHKHLKGTLTTSASVNATWINYKVLDENSLSAVVDFKISNGELVGFEPLRAASKFIRLEELERIRFQDLENTIQIANNCLDLPEFEIKTNALNLIIFGRHYFNNDIDYHFKINLHKLLANKFRRNTSNENFIEEDPYQGLNIYLTMTGNLSNPVIKYDKPSARNKVKEDFKKEKEVLKALLNNRPIPKDENESKREDKYFDTQESPKFIDFDDEPK